MRNVRVLIIALAVLSTALVPMSAKALPSQGGGCEQECFTWDDFDGSHSLCVAGGSMASCKTFVSCAERGYACYGACEGGRCLWV